MPKVILAIDQGTTGTTVAVVDENLHLCASHTSEFRQIFPQPGWVEHDLEDIWSSVLTSIRKALEKARVNANQIQAIGITNQRETTALWDKSSGVALHHAIVWQCRRTTPLCQQLKDEGYQATVSKKTGLVLDPYFSGTKLRWLLDNLPDARSKAQDGQLCFGTIDTFLVYRLSGNRTHITDVSNASRTLLMNLKDLNWDEELLSIFDIPVQVLPSIKSSAEIYDYTRHVPGLPDGIPLCGIAGDQQAALFGQTCFKPGQVKCTYGTGAFVLMNTGNFPVHSQNGLLTTVGWKIGDQVTYALEGSVFIAGAAVQWLRDGLGIISKAAQVESLAASVDSSESVIFVPALAGLGAPHWHPKARGTISGITRGTTMAHIARAALEGIAFQVRDVIQAMQTDNKGLLKDMRVDGGASQNDLLLQFQADILGIRLHRTTVLETTALGAAMLAGLSSHVWKDLSELSQRWKSETCFSPQADTAQVSARLKRWQEAINKA
jgi:glycerol kinase